ncbi:nucleotide-binding protein [Candidatus Woesearchaeota archaeon]|nr:nucleotide-binding protein [Candidatus Woesearchaeota archaeon]
MKHIILDTNFLLIPAQFGVDIFEAIDRLMEEPYTIHIVDATLDELERIAATASGRDKAAAALAVKLVKAKGVSTLKTEKNLNTDKLIVELAKRPDYIVATQDRGLKAILKQNDTPVIVLRQKKFLKLF